MYQRIDRQDGTRRPVEARQLLSLLAPQLPSAEEALARVNAGHVAETPEAWYIRPETPWLKPEPASFDESTPAVDRDSGMVVYTGLFYEISADGVEALAEMGAEVCGRELSSEQATYSVLVGEGLSVPEPDEIEPDALSALLSLHVEATYLERRIFSGDYGPRRDELDGEMRMLAPRIHEPLGRASLVIGRLRDAAVKSPKLLDQRSERERIIFDRVRVELLAWLLRSDLASDDINFFRRAEWTTRGERYGRNSILTVTFEGAALYHILNDTFEDYTTAARLYEELQTLLAAQGFYFELGYSWSFSLYPL